jgi:hypothetical protein
MTLAVDLSPADARTGESIEDARFLRLAIMARRDGAAETRHWW